MCHLKESFDGHRTTHTVIIYEGGKWIWKAPETAGLRIGVGQVQTRTNC